MLDPQETHPDALRLQVIIDMLYRRLKMRAEKHRTAGTEQLYEEAVQLVERMNGHERRVDTVERAMKALNEQLRITQNRASAYQHQAQVMEEGIASAIGLLDGTSAGLRQTRSRISGRQYEPT